MITAETATTSLEWRHLGCVAGINGLAEAFTNGHQQSLGVLNGFDEPKVIPIDDTRDILLLQDGYIDSDLDGGTYDYLDYRHNSLVVADYQTDGTICLTLAGSPGSTPGDFELGDGSQFVRNESYLWPLHGTISTDGKLNIFWQYMERSQGLIEGTDDGNDGVVRSPRAVYLATYNPETLQRESWNLAPDPDIRPMFGVTVVDDNPNGFTYLFGNAVDRNLRESGGFDNGPHPSTSTYVARVALGQLGDLPEYWNGETWTGDQDSAAVINQRGWTEHIMAPVLIDGQWISVTKGNGWWVTGLSNSVPAEAAALDLQLIIETADNPQGPWTQVFSETYIPTLGANSETVFGLGHYQNSYGPIIWARHSTADELTIIISQNAWDWRTATNHASEAAWYWPAITTINIAETGDEPA